MACAPEQTAGKQTNKEWRVQSYVEQRDGVWPGKGRHILAQYDEDTIVVYQAYCPEIAEYAVRNQKFGGDRFSFSRMSWIKPNFLWMMYRSGWAGKKYQERVLAVRITRAGFDHILSNVKARLQWDPDHGPSGEPTIRRAIQLGLRGELLRRYSEEWIVDINDITEFVRQQYYFVKKKQTEKLLVAEERVYPVTNPTTAARINIDTLTP